MSLVALPWVGPALGLGTVAARIIGLVLVVLLLLGTFPGVLGGGFVYGKIMGQVEAALALLETHGLDLPPDELRRAAVRILSDHIVDVGPTSTNTYDRNEARARLGEALSYVEVAERFLVVVLAATMSTVDRLLILASSARAFGARRRI